jgi:hypothetical protein
MHAFITPQSSLHIAKEENAITYLLVGLVPVKMQWDILPSS